MRKRVHLFVTLAVILPVWAFSIYYFIRSLDSARPLKSLLVLGVEQVNYLLLMIVCWILLYEIVERALRRNEIRRVLVYGFQQPRYKRVLLKVVGWMLAIPMFTFGCVIHDYRLNGVLLTINVTQI